MAHSLLILFVIAVTTIAVAGIVLGLVRVWRWRRPFGPAVVLALFAFLGLDEYRVRVRPDSFYRHVFERDSHLAFPKSGRIIARSASNPDIHGDYCAAAVFEVGETDWASLQSAAETNNFEPRESFGDKCVEGVEIELGRRVAIVYGPQHLKDGGEFFEWGPVGTNRQVMLHYASW